MVGQITIDEFRAKVDASRVKCRLCPFEGHALIKHLKDVHNMSAGQYRKQLNEDAQVFSPIGAELMRRLDRRAQVSDDLSYHLNPFTYTPKNDTSELERLGKGMPSPPELEAYIPKLDKMFKFTTNAKVVAYSVVNSMNLYLAGPTGCGKTAEVTQTHGAMRRPMRRCNMQGDVTAANFIGQMKADKVKGTYFHEGILPTCMRQGITLLVDEFDFTPPHIGVVLHPVLEGDKTLFLPDTGETIVAKKGFAVIATANTGGKGDSNGVYTGTEILNTATLDRFPLKINADYLKEKDEQEMLAKRFPTATRTDIAMMVKGANELRNAFKIGQISTTFSTRKLIDYFELKKSFTPEESLELTITNWLGEEDRQLVKDILIRVGIIKPAVVKR